MLPTICATDPVTVRRLALPLYSRTPPRRIPLVLAILLALPVPSIATRRSCVVPSSPVINASALVWSQADDMKP